MGYACEGTLGVLWAERTADVCLSRRHVGGGRNEAQTAGIQLGSRQLTLHEWRKMGQIEIKNLTFAYMKGADILKDISLSVSPGESVGLVGANGAGKSTLLKILVGLNPGFAGSVTVGGIPVEKGTLPEIRQKIGYVFQDSDSQLFMTTVGEDVAFGPRNYGLSESEVRARTERALAETGITHIKDRPIMRLSGGEKKLASIATILSMEPEILLLDEPSIALDPKNRRNIINILNHIQATKIIASHDLDMIMDTCSRTVLMTGGKIIADGPTDKILRDKALLEENSLELPLRLQ